MTKEEREAQAALASEAGRRMAQARWKDTTVAGRRKSHERVGQARRWPALAGQALFLPAYHHAARGPQAGKVILPALVA